MTDKKISELTSITGADVSDANDVLPIVDTSVATTKKITRAELFKSVSSVDIADKIVHTGDTDTAIRFPAADTVTVETAGSERVRIDSSGNVGIGTASPTNFGGGYIVSQTTGSSGGYSLQSSGTVITQMAADSTASVGYTGTRSNHPHVFTTNNTERMRIDSSGNLLVGTATSPSGSGQIVANVGVYLGGTTSANLLDDYEEGTFTPVLTTDATAPSLTVSAAAGRYTKVGNTVNIWIYISVSALASAGTGNAIITGLPFTCGDTQGGVNSNWAAATWATSAPTAGHIPAFATSILLVRYDGAGTTRITASDFDSSFEITLHGLYRT